MRITNTLEAVPKNPKRVEAGKQGGRPSKGRTENIQIKVTPEERAILTAAAHSSGKTLSDLFRDLIIAPPTIEEGAISILIKNNPTYLTLEQAKDLYKQLTKVLLGD